MWLKSRYPSDHISWSLRKLPGRWRFFSRPVVALILLLTTASGLAAQSAPTRDELFNRLPLTARVLMVGAHPDDENSALLEYLSRGLGVRCAYLSATRGEGGQNLIGPELFEALGIIRTEELLAARQYDQCDQFFTRAFDFGFSKDPNEAFAKWGREETLGDMVRVIRRYRPDVVISVWQGKPSDGHGHHQAIGILTPEAFRDAADSAKFPEQLRQGLHTWQPKRLYVMVRDLKDPQSFSRDVGSFDSELLRSLPEIAAIGRSQHQTQGQGSPRRQGPVPVYLKLADGPPGVQLPGDSQAVRADFDELMKAGTESWAADAGTEQQIVPTLTIDLKSLDALARKIAARPEASPAEVVPQVAEGIQALRALRLKVLNSALRDDHQFALDEHLRSKERDFSRALEAVLGLSFQVRAAQPAANPGEKFEVTARLLNRSGVPVEPVIIEAAPRPGWRFEKLSGESKPLGFNQSVEWRFSVTPPVDALPTEMYWLRLPRKVDRYEISNQALIGLAEDPPELMFLATYRAAGITRGLPFRVERPVEYVRVDPRYGERHESFKVVPPVSVSVELGGSSAAQTRDAFVRIESTSPRPIDGTVSLILPKGWRSTPSMTAVSVVQRGDAVTKKFVLHYPPNLSPGQRPIFAIAKIGNQNFLRGFQTISYPHIHEQNIYEAAQTVVNILDLKLPPHLKVGYITGTGDRVPEALAEMGVSVTELNERALSTANLAVYDAIVTGIRAYDVRRDLDQNNARLLDYVRRGGTLIVQYNSVSFGANPSLLRRQNSEELASVDKTTDSGLRKQPEELKGPQSEEKISLFVDATRQFGPYPMLRGLLTDRVVDEQAPVTLLAATNPIFTSPNRITSRDFDGWVQERGLYFMSAWDARYTPLLASHDPGEKDLPGGMLYARYGKGNFVYTGYAWFRQLPAGVSGAIRIFANMISLSRTISTKTP